MNYSNSINIIIGKKISLWRRARGLTTMQLGEKLGISSSQIMKYERVEDKISASRLYELAKVLSVNVSDFLLICLPICMKIMKVIRKVEK